MAKMKLFSMKGLMPNMNLGKIAGVSAKDLGFSKGTSFSFKPKRRRKKTLAQLMKDI